MIRKNAAQLFIIALGLAESGAAEDCKPSRWDADDQIGNANLITEQGG